MSYDFHMVIDAGGETPHVLDGFDRNITYNVAPIFHLALGPEVEGGVRGLAGKTGAEMEPHLARAVAKMKADMRPFEALNPSNGWGSAEGALDCLQMLWRWAQDAPKAQLRIT